MAPACKEWAVIVHALLEGEQILDVRKGGLREDGRHFSVQSTRFWLYPTAEHQKPELLKEPYRHWIDLAHAAPVGEPITIEGWADVVKVATVTEAEELDAIASKLIWTDDYAASRLGWKKRDPLWVLALRVHRLLEPVTVPWDDALRRLHVVGGARRPPRRPRVAPERARALRRRVRGPPQGLRRRAAHARRPRVAGSSRVSRRRRPRALRVRAVAAVAGLAERVGREGGELLRREQLGDGLLGAGVVGVEVVDDLLALVAQVAELLEARRSAHRR